MKSITLSSFLSVHLPTPPEKFRFCQSSSTMNWDTSTLFNLLTGCIFPQPKWYINFYFFQVQEPFLPFLPCSKPGFDPTSQKAFSRTWRVEQGALAGCWLSVSNPERIKESLPGTNYFVPFSSLRLIFKEATTLFFICLWLQTFSVLILLWIAIGKEYSSSYSMSRDVAKFC